MAKQMASEEARLINRHLPDTRELSDQCFVLDWGPALL